MQVQYRTNGKDVLLDTGIEKIEHPADDPSVRLSVVIGGIKFATEFRNNTEYAVIALQKLLPKNVEIICCQSCAHGHFCPVGDQDDEIFCITDFEPKRKEDIIDAIVDGHKWEKRSRHLLHVCAQYERITDEKYSYNDWQHDIAERDKT
jgi:hypothetical protein